MSEQSWNTRTVYRVMGDDEPRDAVLLTFVPEDKEKLRDAKEIGVGAGIVIEFLRAELSPQMLEVVLAMLYSKGQQFFDKTMDMAQETLKLQREVIQGLQPPQRVIDLVELEVEWLADPEEQRPLVEWLERVTVRGSTYDREEGEGEEGGHADRGEESVGEEAADGAP